MHFPGKIFQTRKELYYKERTVQAMSNLETEIKAMHSLGNRLRIDVGDSLFLGMRSENKEITSRHADECDDLVKLLDIVNTGEMLLHNMSMKMESARYLEEFIKIMDSAMRSVQTIKSDISAIVPEMISNLDRINSSIIETKSALQISEMERRDHELPAILPQVNFELPPITQMRCSNNSGINLTTFTTGVHTPI